MLVSIVIPCYQNQGQLQSTVEQIIIEIEWIDGFSFEIILVDDASTDSTWQAITALSSQFIEVKGIRLEENIGAYYALLSGFETSKGNSILIMAADGDDPPQLIPELISNLTDSVDAVLAVKESSDKGILSNLLSKLFHSTLRLLGARNIVPRGSDFLIVRKDLIQKCADNGWKSGNTLVQIVQYATTVASIGYRKGNNRKSTWTFSKRFFLFVETVNQFLTIPGISNKPRSASVSHKV